MKALSCSAALLLVATTASAATPSRPLILELFTSQGCSSCPPADALLVELASRADLLPLALHVTYWNALGWQDPYSLGAATERQRYYAGVLHQDDVYTPELVVDGRHSVIGSDRRAVASALQALSKDVAATTGLRLHRGPSGFAIEVGRSVGAGNVWLVGFDRRRSTKIGHGENGGRTIVEANVVRLLQPVGVWTGAPLHLEVAQPQGDRFAALLQAPDGRILDAARLEGVAP